MISICSDPADIVQPLYSRMLSVSPIRNVNDCCKYGFHPANSMMPVVFPPTNDYRIDEDIISWRRRHYLFKLKCEKKKKPTLI